MILFKEIDYKIKDLFCNNVNYYYIEYQDCFASNLRVLNAQSLQAIDSYKPIIEKDIFEDSHIIHHDFRLVNGILYSLKQKGFECQAFKVKDGWKIYKKVNNFTPLISCTDENDFWLSPCSNFCIRRYIQTEGRKTPKIMFDLKAIGVDNSKVGILSSTLEDVLEEYYKPELHIQSLYFTKEYDKYKDKLIEILKK